MSRMYHFSLGNSSVGPVGFCAAVVADSPREAVERLKAILPEEHPADDFSKDDMDRDEYIRAYFNADAITEANIDFVED